jgi:uncharacterized membrane protein
MVKGWMTRRDLLKVVDAERVQKAIRQAEEKTSGQIRVSVSTLHWGDPRRAAEKAFERLGMRATRRRNGILFFIVPARRRFVVLGDEGIHARVGQAFWHDVVAAVGERFRKGDFTDGIVHGIETVGKELAAHFPPDAEGRNELPDDVDFGR